MNRRLGFVLVAAVSSTFLSFAASPRRTLNLRPLEVPAGAGSASPRFTEGMDGRLYLSWIEPSSKGHAFRFASFDGKSWTGAKTVSDGPAVLVGVSSEPGVLALPNGLLAAQWLMQTPQKEANDIVVSLSRDAGKTWTPPRKPYRDKTPGEHMYVSLFGLPSGIAGIVWLDPRGGKNTSLIQTTLDSQGRIGVENVIAPDVCSCCPTSSAITNRGPVVMYRTRTRDNIRDIFVIAFQNGKWGGQHPVHDDGWKVGGCPTNSGAIAAKGEKIAAAWFTASGGNKRVEAAFSADGGKTFSGPVIVDDHKPIGRASLALLDDGSALATWLGFASGTTVLYAWQVWPDGRFSEAATVARARSGGKFGFPFAARLNSNVAIVWTDWDGDKALGVHAAVASSNAE